MPSLTLLRKEKKALSRKNRSRLKVKLISSETITNLVDSYTCYNLFYLETFLKSGIRLITPPMVVIDIKKMQVRIFSFPEHDGNLSCVN